MRIAHRKSAPIPFRLVPRSSPGDRCPTERGVLLLECLVYLMIWAIVLGLAFTAFYQYWDYSKRLNRTADDIARAVWAGEAWRADLRKATAAPRQVTEGGREQALHIRQKTGEVVYLFLDGSIRRRPNADAPWTEVLSGVKTSEMRADARQGVTAWRWDVELKSRQPTPQVRPLFSFEAVAGPGS
jgi:Tfp pilus assembly protein FimT